MKIGFYSCMDGTPWGGSEELWSRVAQRLLREGKQVAIDFRQWPEESSSLRNLRDLGASISTRPDFLQGSIARWGGIFRTASSTTAAARHQQLLKHVCNWLDIEKPEYVLITASYQGDRIAPAQACIDRGIPYAINLQCANTTRFVPDYDLEEFRKAYSQADRVWVVSAENLQKLQMNLALTLKNTEQVDNPYQVDPNAHLEWPDTRDGFRLACVGRIDFVSKGQDVLVDVLCQQKWRERDLTISLFGSVHQNGQLLHDLIDQKDLRRVIQLKGFVDSVEDIWRDHHGLVLPSRYEGAALAVVEAMLCGRICITTDLGRNRELIDDGESGFIAHAATPALLDEALERAWNKRETWEQMGNLAGQQIRERFSSDPVGDFCQELHQRIAATGHVGRE